MQPRITTKERKQNDALHHLQSSLFVSTLMTIKYGAMRIVKQAGLVEFFCCTTETEVLTVLILHMS